MELSSSHCVYCNDKGYITKSCPACFGSGNATSISKYRMQHDIDYWVCEVCRGMKTVRVKCKYCEGIGVGVNNTERYKERTLQFFNIRYMCEPKLILRIYENIGFLGTGIINGNIRFDNGRFSGCSKKSINPSNGWYNYIVNTEKIKVSYLDSLVQREYSCLTYGTKYKDGPPALDWNGKEQKINRKEELSVFEIIDGKSCNIIYENDSTIIEKFKNGDYYRKYIISTDHIKVMTSVDKDMWNVEMWLDKGLPIRIKDYSGDRCYRYVEFDSNKNWIKREEIDEEGKVIQTVKRDITYIE